MAKRHIAPPIEVGEIAPFMMGRNCVEATIADIAIRNDTPVRKITRNKDGTLVYGDLNPSWVESLPMGSVGPDGKRHARPRYWRR